MWFAFGTSDCGLGRARLAQFVGAGLQDAFTNPLLHGSARLAERLGAGLEPTERRETTSIPLGSQIDPSSDRFSTDVWTERAIEDAAHTAFHRHAYTY